MSSFQTHSFDGLGEFSELNIGAQSNPSSSSSQAVLNALRTLQDKIRRFETERTLVLDEVTQLRLQVKNQEIETENFRQRESLSAQKALHEARTAYERALTEKTDTEVRLSKVEERNREEQRIAEDLRAKMRSLEEEKHNGHLTLKDLEAQKSHLQNQITYTQQKEKELGQTILWDTKRHEEDMEVLSSKLRTLQGELSRGMQEKADVEMKMLELDQLVGQLLSVNESLVTKLSGKTGGGIGKTYKKGVKKVTISKPVFVPRAASLSTVSFDHSRKVAGGLGVPAKAVMAKALDEAGSLQKMHKMYVDLAHNITQSNSTIRKRPSSAPAMHSHGGHDHNEGHDDMNFFGSAHARSSSDKFKGVGSDSLYRSGGISAANGVQQHHKGDLRGVISSLEEEFTMLNGQYRRLLAAVQAQSPSVDSSQAEELVKIIQQLHQKGEQLRTLRTPSPTR